MVLKVYNDEKEFVDIISRKDLVAVMIHKTGCPFCEKAEPWMKELGDELTDRIVCEVNKDDIPDLMGKFNLVMYPTFVLIREGKVLDIFYGDTQEDKVKSFISKEV